MLSNQRLLFLSTSFRGKRLLSLRCSAVAEVAAKHLSNCTKHRIVRLAMTAEVIVLNREAVAMAADSAVTVKLHEGTKIFTSANKIFALSADCPIGVMVYDSATLMGLPWETIVKVYRQRAKGDLQPTVDAYASSFLEFIAEGNLFPGAYQRRQYEASVYAYFSFIRKQIEERAKSAIHRKGQVDEAAVERMVSEVIEKHFGIWAKAPSLPTVPDGFLESVKKEFASAIDKAIGAVFEKFPLSEELNQKLVTVAASLPAKWPPPGISPPASSGVVLAGFGTEDVFPAVRAFSTSSVLNNVLLHKRLDSHCVDIDFEWGGGAIVPFAQREMVMTFMEGVDPGYQQLIEQFIREIGRRLPKAILDKIDCIDAELKAQVAATLQTASNEVLPVYLGKLVEYRKGRHIDPVMKVVTMLPKDELASMAEALVSLTSLKRRMTIGEQETVGGPIDVAVISKGDGLIWVKRKHYFHKDLNPRFFAKYYREGKWEKQVELEEGRSEV